MASDQEMKDCPICGESILAVARKCKFCGEYLDEESRTMNRPPPPSGVERMLVPVGRPVSAIAAGYCGLLGLFPMIGIPFAVGGIITGIVALQTLKKNPELSGAGRAWFGIIAGSLMTLLSLFMIVALFAGAGMRRH